MNLTAMSAEQLWHVLSKDSWRMSTVADVKDGETIMDIGSGGGVVGIPFAIWNANARVVLVDPVRKKTSFLLYVAGILRLRNVTVVTSRLGKGDLAHEWQHSVDCLCSRAALPHDYLLREAEPLLSESGRVVLWLHDARHVASEWNAGASPRHARAFGEGIVRW